MKTHDVVFLLNECALLDPMFSTIDVQNINDYAVLTRYPDSSIMPKVEEAKEYYRLAIEVNKMVKDRLVFSE